MTNTREYLTVRDCSEMLEITVKRNREVCYFLHQEGYITKDQLEEYLDPKTLLTPTDKAGNLVTAIKDRVELDPRYYHKLVDYFKKGNQKVYGSIVRALRKKYRDSATGNACSRCTPHAILCILDATHAPSIHSVAGVSIPKCS
jgi:hypothetical protein